MSEGAVMNRQLLTKLHLVLAALMFPAIVMFLITGGLYTWGEKGAWHEEVAQIQLAAPLAAADEATLRQIARAQLQSRDIPLPSGPAKLDGDGAAASYQWTGARSDIVLRPTADPRQVEMTIKQASFHRWMVQLHKAKGSTVFKAYATFLAIALLLLVASGLTMGLQTPALRGLTIASGLVGAVAFLGAALLG